MFDPADQALFDELEAAYEKTKSIDVLRVLHRPWLLGTVPATPCSADGWTARMKFCRAMRRRLKKQHVVCHRCDNFGCSNLAHLFLGDYSTNMFDLQYKLARGLLPGNDRYLSPGCEYFGWKVIDRVHRQSYTVQHLACGEQQVLEYRSPFFSNPLGHECAVCGVTKKRKRRRRGAF